MTAAWFAFPAHEAAAEDLLSEVLEENSAAAGARAVGGAEPERLSAGPEEDLPFADILGPGEPESPPPGSMEPSIVVMVPEQIEVEWYWYFYTDVAQHIVQSAIEKRLIDAGHTVLEITDAATLGGGLTIERILKRSTALEAARRLGATYLVHGRATAAPGSRSTAYGVNVFRSTADISAKVIRVADGKVLAVEEESHTAGAEAQKAAGRKALREGGRVLAKKIGRAFDKVSAVE
jgi:hypothetical protein